MLYKLLTHTGPSVVGATTQALTGMSVAGFSLGGGDPGYVGTGGTASFGDARGGAGSYGPTGSGMSHLTPSMQGRLSAMMRDNPQIQIVSGHRDGGTQERLRRKGVGNLAPTGHSTHSQGVAADLGPSSQYDWIAKNAHKYGLDSAAHHGEKWHVGLPGTVGVFGSGSAKSGGIGDWKRGPDGSPTIDFSTGEYIDETTGKPVPGSNTNKGKGMGGVGEALGGATGIPGGASLGGLYDAGKGLYDAATTGVEWMQAITAMVGGNFSPLMAKIQESNPIGTLGKGLFGLLSSQFPGMEQFNPFTGVYGASGGHGVEVEGSAGSFWKDPSSSGGGFMSGAVSRAAAAAAAAGNGGVTVGQNFAGGATGSAKQIALAKLQAKGWGQYWKDLDQLVSHESGWNPTAQNPSSTAYGLFQFLDSTWKGTGFSKSSDPNVQIEAGLKYIESRYGNPQKAWDFWQRQSPHWYELGGTHFNGPEMIGAGEKGPEVTIPLNNPSRLKALTDAYIRPNYPKGSDSLTYAGAAGQSKIEVHIPIELKVQVTGNASSGDLREVSRVLATQVEQDLADVVARHA
jgi:hypothetical protein